ncbi:RcnB family protein [Shimwellia pseudoproteus]|uniref:RcnB family protein n=1 Tax=Shimwellia pseudoproteus TaxID=570012 RepID=UPI0018EAE2AF|nr:RcnB family protein [Shimwellia pseudoproteus]MBJ3816759.1 RcnB family protein [Shimwellia pseudoproteus]
MKKLIALTFVAACVTAPFTWADGPGGHGGDQQQWQHAPQGGPQGGAQNNHYDNSHNNHYDDHHDDHRDNHQPSRDNHHGPQFSGGHTMAHRDYFRSGGHDFRRGYPMPQEYRGSHYRIDDWRDRGLPEPPHDGYWSYIDGNYILVAAATGIISAIVYSAVTGN